MTLRSCEKGDPVIDSRAEHLVDESRSAEKLSKAEE